MNELLAKKYIDKRIKTIQAYFYQLLISHKEIESPIEQLFFLEWHFQNLFSDHDIYNLIPQYQDKTTGKYYLDFALIGNNKMIGIEIDGHDFHEKTKKQAQYDKQRDRFLQSKGWTILRFTGSEIYKNPKKCVDEVSKIASKENGIMKNV